MLSSIPSEIPLDPDRIGLLVIIVLGEGMQLSLACSFQ